MGWASKKNGELLALAAAEFDVFLTSDRNLSHQLNVGKFDIAVLVLVAGSNRLDDLRPLLSGTLKVPAQGAAVNVSVVRMPRGSFGVDVCVQIAPVEPQVLPELHDRQAVFSIWSNVLVDPRHAYLQKLCGLLDRQQIGEVVVSGGHLLDSVELSRGYGHCRSPRTLQSVGNRNC
jgi:hypothetical protein